MDNIINLEEAQFAIDELIREEFLQVFNSTLAGIVFLVIILLFASFVSSFLENILNK